MKKILISLIGLIGILGFVACDDETPEVRQERKVFYTHSEGAGLPAFSGTTVRLTTDAEWDALLDRFCDYAQEGAQVMFCSVSSNSKGSSTNTPTSISTNDREELKAWMKEMEKAGKTVQVTYDEGSNTWNGRAYANLNHQDTAAEPQTYNGTLCFVNTPAVDGPAPGGTVWALATDNGTLVLTIHGMMLWNESVTPEMTLLDGSDASLRGTVSSHSDLNGDTFFSIDLEIPEDGVIEF